MFHFFLWSKLAACFSLSYLDTISILGKFEAKKSFSIIYNPGRIIYMVA